MISAGSSFSFNTLYDFLQGNENRCVVRSVSVSSSGYGPTEIDMQLLVLDGDYGSVSISDESQWKKASKKSPSDDSEVLVCRDGTVTTAVYWGPKHGWSIEPPPTHWMPMPKPAKGKT